MQQKREESKEPRGKVLDGGRLGFKSLRAQLQPDAGLELADPEALGAALVVQRDVVDANHGVADGLVVSGHRVAGRLGRLKIVGEGLESALGAQSRRQPDFVALELTGGGSGSAH